MHVFGYARVSLMSCAYGPPRGIYWLLLPSLASDPRA